MKTATFTFLLLLSCCHWLAAQCPTGYVTFSSQAQINTFSTNYPGCTEIAGDVFIQDNITNLNGLSQLTSIGGYLEIYNNDALTSLAGLHNITSIGGYLKIHNGDALTSTAGLDNITYIGGDLDFFSNDALTSLAGLGNVISIDGNIRISYNDALTSLAGLDNLTTIGGGIGINGNDLLTSLAGLENITSVGGYLSFFNTTALTSLAGLENITSIGGDLNINTNAVLASLTGLNALTSIGGDIDIKSNSALTSLTGLENVTTIGGDLNIYGNAALSNCEVQAICEFLAVSPDNATIYGNAEGCSSVGQVQLACGIPVTCPANVTFTTQAELDAFPATYASCTTITGNVAIQGPDITNLNGLTQITAIGGELKISSNEGMASLNGLDNITSIGSLNISSNDGLTSLTGLDNITSIGSLNISSNDGLTSLTGLDNITFIGSLYISGNNALSDLTSLENITSVPGTLSIGATSFFPPGLGSFIGNDALTSLAGLENITSVGHLGIYGNDALVNLSALSSLAQVTSVDIRNNQVLASLEGLQNVTAIPGGLSIQQCPLHNLTDLENLSSLGALSLLSMDSLTSLAGLENIDSIPGTLTIGFCPLPSLTELSTLHFVNSLVIYRLDSLTNLAGLENLDSIPGSLSIGSVIGQFGYPAGNGNLADLNGLENLVHVGSLGIVGNPLLTNLNGLENLASVTDNLEIIGNEVLTDLSKLGNITSLSENLIIGGNDSLTNLNGLQNLNYVGIHLLIGYTGYHNALFGNPSLVSLSALENLDSVGQGLYIIGNESLTNLAGLRNLVKIGWSLNIYYNNSLKGLCGLNDDLSIGSSVSIYENATLETCQAQAICELLSNPSSNYIYFSNNAPGCNTAEEIEAACSAPAQADHYVDDTATGTGNGASWVDAFANLQAALAIAQEGDEIWVAEGTYLPGSSPSATFWIDKNLKLYGGFLGSECMLTERGDPAEHPAILSGDLNGDDIDDNFTQNRSDNARHVVRVNASVTNEALLDGFTIRNGHSVFVNPLDNQGGGIFSSGTPVVRRCIFKQNYSELSGGAVGVYANSPNAILFENCRFEKNYANSGGAIMTTTLAAAKGNSTQILDCVFKENKALEDGGGLRYHASQDSVSLLVKGCEFDGNVAGEAGAVMILSQANSNVANAHYRIEDCTFTENSATGIYSDGGAVFTIMRGPNVTMEIVGSTFTGNQAPNMGEGTVGLWATNNGTGLTLVDSCLFENNASYFGAAIQCGNVWNGGSSVSRIIKRSRFIGNLAAKGGALDLYSNENSLMDIFVEDCLFEGNLATQGGGAVSFSPGSDGFQLLLSRCEMLNNESPVGGAVEGYNFGGAKLPAATIRLENSLIAQNTSQSSAIHLDSISDLQIINSTIAGNISDGIKAVDKSAVVLQNTILANPGHTEFTIATGATFTSLGGNLISDNSLNSMLMSTDQSGVEPDFDSDFFPTEGGNLVNAGVNTGVAALDLAGNERIQHGIVDIGAYESPYNLVSTSELIAGEVALSPNPVAGFLNIHLPETTAQTFNISIYDTQGRLATSFLNAGLQKLNVEGLLPGVYSVKVLDGERVYVGKFIKQ